MNQSLWRVGRSVGRTLYRQVAEEPSQQDELIGLMDTPELAQQVVDAIHAQLGLTPEAAAWLLTLVEHAVPADQTPGGPMNWEGAGRRRAYELLTAVAGAMHYGCSATCDLGQGHGGRHLSMADWQGTTDLDSPR